MYQSLNEQRFLFCSKSFGSCNITSREDKKINVSTSLNLGSCFSRGESSCKFTCLASLADFDAIAGSGWLPIGDQVLLTASIFLTYMAGVIPVQKDSSYSSRKDSVVEENLDVGTSESSGR